MTAQESFLKNVRDRLHSGNPENLRRPVASVANEPILYTRNLEDPVAAFLGAAMGAEVEIIGLPDDGLEAILDRAIESVAPERVAISGDPECSGVLGHFDGLGIEIVSAHDKASVSQADLGITGALCGVALTGSVVVDSRRAGGRLASLLPRTHLVLLPAESIVRTPGDVLRNLSALTPGGLPSNLVFITGPSRSADIELELTLGVHGPQRVLIALR